MPSSIYRLSLFAPVLFLLGSLLHAPSAGAQHWVYTVAEEDNLWDLSVKFLDRVDHWKGLQRLNNVKNPRHLQPGTRLRVPLAWIRSNPTSATIQDVAGSASLRRASGEALVRWYSRELGQVSPGNFIPVAEQTGSILRIGNWVLEQACQQAQQWRQRGLREIRMAVNLSPVQFAQPDLVEIIVAILDRTGLPPPSTGTGDHRDGVDARCGGCGEGAHRLEGVRYHDRYRRLRDRLLVIELPETLPPRPPQDRSVLHSRTGQKQRKPRNHPGHHRYGPPIENGGDRRGS